MRKATGSGDPFTELMNGYTLTPPVVRLMRSVSSTKLSFFVPICVRALPACRCSMPLHHVD